MFGLAWLVIPSRSTLQRPYGGVAYR